MPASLREFDLPEAYRPALGDPLQVFLRDYRSAPVSIGMAALRRVDTLVAQVLLVAAEDWRGRGLPFTLTGLRPEIDEALRQIGVTADLLDRRVSA